MLEAKMAGNTLTGVEPQLSKYATGLPDGLDPPVTPLPFLYLSTGDIPKFTNLLDPEPRSRRIFHLHGPETLADWLAAPTLDAWVKDNGTHTAADAKVLAQSLCVSLVARKSSRFRSCSLISLNIGMNGSCLRSSLSPSELATHRSRVDPTVRVDGFVWAVAEAAGVHVLSVGL